MGSGSPPEGRARRTRLRWLWLALGWLSVALGSIGIVVPGLPTTVFFIMAASCFARASPRFERWVLELPKIGPLVRDHRAGLGMPRRAKITAIGVMLAAVAVSAGFLLSSPAWRITVVILGAVGAGYIGWRVPTREEPP
ncbi:MAG: YbaN family protein [Egibacteraceae bacterium]